MIAHLFTLVWNRWRAGILVVVEIFFCFIVVYAVLTAGVYFAEQYTHPLGFSYENVWRISLEQRREYYNAAEEYEQTQQLLHVVRSLDEVVNAATATVVPYSSSTYTSSFEYKNKSVSSMLNWADEDFDDVMGIRPIRGRWFEKGDEVHSWSPLVINEGLARRIFGDADPVGKAFPSSSEGERERRIIGVVSDFRQGGELSAPGNYYFQYAITRDTAAMMGRDIVFTLRPGTPPIFSERLLQRLHAEYPNMIYRLKPLVEMRSSSMQARLVPLLIAGIVAGFLLLMAGLGLVGVLWQNVARRTREIGLRRAVGAGVRDIYVQILGELFVLMSFALLIGTLIVVQIPMLELIGGVPASVYFVGLAGALGVMYLLALACGLYPAILATRIQPTEALHYE